MSDSHLNCTFDYLTVKKFLYKKRNGKFYECECKCGNKLVKNIYDLRRKKRNNTTFHCGCKKTHDWEKYVGTKINKLDIIKFNGFDKNNAANFKYRCFCGNVSNTSHQNLQYTQSCGRCFGLVNVGDKFYNYTVLSKELKSKSKVKCTICNNISIIKNDTLVKKKTNRCCCVKKHKKFKKESKLRLKYKSYIQAATKRNNLFELSFQEFKNLIIKPCFYCNKYDKKIENIDITGVDRINSKEGYNIDNCVPCCYNCNYMKMDKKQNEFYDKIVDIYNNLELWRINESNK